MGADLYIDSIYQKNKNKYQAKFYYWIERRNEAKTDTAKEKAQEYVSKYYDKMYEKGYFRDSYNATSLFWQLGLSWWQCKYIEKGEISPRNAEKLLKQVKETQLKPIPEGWCKENHASGKEEEWEAFFKKEKELFEKFLEEAIKLNESIIASV